MISGHGQLLRTLMLAAVLFIPFVSATPSKAQPAEITRENAIKAAYLLKFPLYVTWPEEAFNGADSPLVIGVLEDGLISPILARRAPRATAKGRKIVIQRFRSLDDYRPCHVLFVPSTVDPKIQSAAIARTRRSPVLIVGETGGFAAAGGAFNFYVDVDNTIGFEINPDATQERNVRVDARLLQLGKMIRTQPPPAGG